MKDDAYIFIMNHGQFGEELIKSAELIIGKIDHIQAISLLKGMSLEDLFKEANEKFSSVPGRIIVLTDLFGGTPNNVAMMLQKKFDLNILCGVNLPMLMDIALTRGSKTFCQLMESGIRAGKEAIMNPRMSGFKEMEDF